MHLCICGRIFLVKYHAFSIFLWIPYTDAFELWKLFFEKHLILDVNLNLGGLFRGSLWGFYPLSKTRWNYARNLKFGTYVHTYVVSENISFSTRILLILVMPAFFFKKSTFFGKISTFTQSNSVRTVLETSVLLRLKVTINENGSFTDYASGIRFPECSKLVINRKDDNDVTIFRQDVIVKVFWRCLVSPVKSSYWSKFHVNIITGSGVMTISFHKGLARNPEIRNNPVWLLPNTWRLGWDMDTKFGTNVSNEMLLNAAKSQGYGFHRFWIIKVKPTGDGG